MLDTKPKEISEIQRLNYEQVTDPIFVMLKQIIYPYAYIYWSLSIAFQAYCFLFFYALLKM